MNDFTTNKEKNSRSVFSEIQKRKVHHLFNVLDIDRNGKLQSDDFINVGKKIIVKLGIPQESRSARVIILKAYRLFVQLLAEIDNPELELTLWDWVEFFRNQMESADSRIIDHYIHHTSRYIFDLFDVNKDQLISREEYADMLTVYNIPQNTANEGFEELDANDDNFISSDEMIDGLCNFFKSSDAYANGNMIFGEWR